MDDTNDVIPRNELFDSFRPRKSKRKRVGLGFAKRATDILLNLIESILPRGGLEWDLIAVRYNEVTGEGRSGTALKQKFYRLTQQKKNRGSVKCQLMFVVQKIFSI